MTSTHDTALEILEISKRDISDEEKLELIRAIIQDYGEDLLADQIPY